MARGGNFVQGKFRPSNPRKYMGDVNNIVYRSSWELQFCRWCDDTPEIVSWNSEELVIPYRSMVDNRMHRYFTDAVVIVQTPQGLRKKIIEIKPFKETQKPKQGKNQKDASFEEDVRTYLVNQSKWAAAREYAQNNNSEFIIITEKQLFPQNHSLKPYRNPKKVAAGRLT